MIPEKTVSADKGRFIGKAKACAADSHRDALFGYEKSDRDRKTRREMLATKTVFQEFSQ